MTSVGFGQYVLNNIKAMLEEEHGRYIISVLTVDDNLSFFQKCYNAEGQEEPTFKVDSIFEQQKSTMLDDINFPFTTATFDELYFDTAIPVECDLLFNLLDCLSASLDKIATRKQLPFLPQEYRFDQVIAAAYRWFVGSGRIIWFSSKVKSAFKPDMKAGSPAFNIDVDCE